MSIQERLDELSPYVTTIRYGKIPIIETTFPKSWGIQKNDKIVVKVVEGDNKLITNCIILSEFDDVSIDDVLEYITQTIKINKEREQKTVLLKAKVEELKEIFNKHTLGQLGVLEFRFVEEGEADLELDLELKPTTDGDTHEDAKVTPSKVAVSGETEVKVTKLVTKPVTKPVTKLVDPKTKVKVELPPKKPVAPKLEEFVTHSCNCGQGQSCPECTDY